MSLVLYSRSLLGPLIALHAFTLGIGLSLVVVILAVTVLAYGVPSYSGAKVAGHSMILPWHMQTTGML
jgi:hypothetical protein